MTQPFASTPPRHASQNPALVAGAWLVVTLPLAWGVYNTVKTSAKLFTSSAPPAATLADQTLTTVPTTTDQKANP